MAGIPHTDPATARKAALFVASEAHDAADCALLLDALGLLGRPVRDSRRVRAQQARKLPAGTGGESPQGSHDSEGDE